MTLKLSTRDYGETSQSVETDAGCAGATKSWREDGTQKAWPYFRWNMRAHLTVASQRVDLTRAIVAATEMNLSVARAGGVSIKLDLLDPVATQGDARLLSRSIAAFLALVVKASDPAACVSCCLTLGHARFATLLIDAAPAPAIAVRLPESLTRTEAGGAPIVSGDWRETLSPWLATLVIEEHGGLVQAIAGAGRPSGIAITLPAKLI